MIKIYTYKNCSTCKKAIKFLKDNSLNFEEHPIRETPPSTNELKTMLASYDHEVKYLFNRSGQDYRAMNLKDKLDSMSIDDTLNLLHSNGNLVKRPFLLSDTFNTVGFKDNIWQELLK